MKKLKLKLLNLFRINIFINPEFNKTCEVLIINEKPEDKLMDTELGITKERSIELAQKTLEILNNGKTRKDKLYVGEIIAQMSKECNHPNELAVVCFNLGIVYTESKNPMSRFIKIL